MANRKDVTLSSKSIEDTLDAQLGMRNDKKRWEFSPAYAVDKVTRRIEAQSRITPTDLGLVRIMAEKLANGVVFPPIILWDDPENGVVLIDGNHRVRAFEKAKHAIIPAYIVSLDSNEEGLLLSAAFNAQIGKPMTAVEIRRAVLAARHQNLRDDQISALFGRDRSTVNNTIAEENATERANKLDLNVDGLTRTHLRYLGRVPMDATFREIGRLAQQTGMPTKELRAFVDEVVAIPSEDAQIEKVREERIARADDIQAVLIGRRAAGSPFSDLRSMIATVARLREQYPDYREWVVKDGAAVAQLLPQVEELSMFISMVWDAYARAVEAAA